MKRRLTNTSALALAVAAVSLCLAAAAHGDDLKIDCCASDGTETDFAGAASGASKEDCCEALDARVKDFEAAAPAKGGNKVSLTASGVVTMEVGGKIGR